jgi:hypothetical protein
MGRARALLAYPLSNLTRAPSVAVGSSHRSLRIESSRRTVPSTSRGRPEPAAEAVAEPAGPSALGVAAVPELARIRQGTPPGPRGQPAPHYATACGGAFF